MGGGVLSAVSSPQASRTQVVAALVMASRLAQMQAKSVVVHLVPLVRAVSMQPRAQAGIWEMSWAVARVAARRRRVWVGFIVVVGGLVS